MDNFEKIFSTLSTTQDPQKIFEEFLDYVIDINMLSFKEYGLDFQGREKQYMEMFREWIFLTNDGLKSNDWFDYLGGFYENIIQSKYKAGNMGQFFTPESVCSLMAEMTLACNNRKGGWINDCCCGSGRLLLAGHILNPTAIIIGQDLDVISVKMAALNFYIHGVKGSVLHMNTLSNEFFGGYKVNQYLGVGFPVPHIEVVETYNEAFQFFLNRNKEEMVDCRKSVPVTMNDNTIQTTLGEF